MCGRALAQEAATNASLITFRSSFDWSFLASIDTILYQLLLLLDKRKVVCFCNSALGLSVVTSCYRSYPDGSFKRKLISNSAVSRIIVA